MEAVGEFLGLDQDAASPTFAGASQRLPAWPDPSHDVRGQAANLWVVKEQLWGRLRDRMPHDPALSCVDSVPTPVCRFGRAYTCARFRGQAAFGRDTGSKATFYGFRHHLRITWPGVVAALSVAPPTSTTAIWSPNWSMVRGHVIGDRNYCIRSTAALAPP